MKYVCFVVKSLLSDFDRWCCANCVYCVIVDWMCILNRPPWLRVQLEWCAWALFVPIVLWFSLHGFVFNWTGWRGRGPSQLCCDSPSMAAWSTGVVGVGAVRPILFDDWLWLLYGTWCILAVWLWMCLFYLFYLSQQLLYILCLIVCGWCQTYDISPT